MQDHLKPFLHISKVVHIKSKKRKTNAKGYESENEKCRQRDGIFGHITDRNADQRVKTNPAEQAEECTVSVEHIISAPKGNLDIEFTLHILTSGVFYSIIIKEKEKILNKIV